MARMGRLAALAALALMAAPLQRGFAMDAELPVAVGVRVTQDSSAARLVFDLSRAVDASAFALTSPNSIVVDLPEVNFQLDPSVGRVGAAPNASLVKGFRFGLLAAGKSRIVVDLARGMPHRGFYKTDCRWSARSPSHNRTQALRSLGFCRACPLRRCFGRKRWRRADPCAAGHRPRSRSRRRRQRRAWPRRRTGKDNRL